MPRLPDERGCVMKATDDSMKLFREKTAKQWDEIDGGWEKLEHRMMDVGVRPVRPDRGDDTTARLNVGGLHIDVPYFISSQQEILDSSGLILFALLFGIWDERLPRDGEGRLFVDESPELSRKFLEIAAQSYRSLAKSSTSSLSPEHVAPFCGSGRSLSYAHGRDAAEVQAASTLLGASTVLGPGDRASFYRLLRDGCPEEPRELQLLYRASRDGFSAARFHTKCDNVGPTITLVRIGNVISSAKESIVGGFSDVSWSGEHSYKDSSAAFIFMLRDDTGHHTSSHAHAKRWRINNEVWHTDARPRAVFCDKTSGPTFGNNELRVVLTTDRDGCNTSAVTCQAAGDSTYEVPLHSIEAYNRLNGRPIVDVEVFVVKTCGGAKPSRHLPTVYATPIDIKTESSSSEGGDVDSCEASLVECVRRERESLQRAKVELAQINTRLDEAVQTMTELYGPKFMGETDVVVELIVRGTPMSTLWSTLQTCPDSALAAMFSKRWQTSKKDVDAHGRRQLDCDPVCFAKVLDVLRSKKGVSSAGARSDEGRDEAITAIKETTGKGTPRADVVVHTTERECFEELVNTYFPGYEDFIMESVRFSSGD